MPEGAYSADDSVSWLPHRHHSLCAFYRKGMTAKAQWNGDGNESCDEMEQFYIYKSAFYSFRCTSGVCMVLWLFTFFTSAVFHTNIFPVLIVGIIWFVSMLSYHIEAYKLSKHKSNTK